MKVGFLYSRIRKDEKLLLNELRDRGHDVVKIDTRDVSLGLSGASGIEGADVDVDVEDLDVVVNRAISYSRGLYSVRFFESYGVPTLNGYEVSRVCGNKVETSLALTENGVPTPETRVAFTIDSALDTIDEMGYPVVVKPVIGSWARLLAKINDPESAEAVLEHKDVLGHYEHSVFYIQNYVDKPGRDIRVIVAGDEIVGAIYRSSDEWITNAARGGEASNCDVTDELEEVALDAAEAVGGGVLGVDVMETDDGYTVHEVNHSLEFKALTEATGIDVASEYVDYIEENYDSS
ncbi:MAG: lysine biosynthesis protein LysX [Halobacteria archaeon]|nr:lysine biosynthesis protein LysX [Halobacteria archaeon]